MATPVKVLNNDTLKIDGQTPKIGDIVFLENPTPLIYTGQVKEMKETTEGKFTEVEPDRVFSYGLDTEGKTGKPVETGLNYYEAHVKKLGGMTMPEYVQKLAKPLIDNLTQLGILNAGYYLRDEVALREDILQLRRSQIMATRISKAIQDVLTEFPKRLDGEIREEFHKKTQNEKRLEGLDQQLINRAW